MTSLKFKAEDYNCNLNEAPTLNFHIVVILENGVVEVIIFNSLKFCGDTHFNIAKVNTCVTDDVFFLITINHVLTERVGNYKRWIVSVGVCVIPRKLISLSPKYRKRTNVIVRGCYHQVCDQFRESWDLSGIEEDAQLLFEVDYDIVSSEDWQNWAETSELQRAK